MAGLYLHIPFCRRKCHYCNFYSLPTRKYRKEIPKAMMIEMEINQTFFNGEPLDTIYVGGGTPSLYPPDDIQYLINAAKDNFRFAENVEITLEANPDDISNEWIEALSASSVNRLSIGVQSFNDDDLHYLHRIHSASQAIAGIEKARKAGFGNLSIDLIYGIPGQTDEQWIENIKMATALKIPHISAYALTVEKGTTLDFLIKKGKLPSVDDDKAAGQFMILMQAMSNAGYLHYEISNFALPGYFSRHNTAYWNGQKYLGIGPSAHSFDGTTRRWNVSLMENYIRGVYGNSVCYESETLSLHQLFDEYVMTSLRTMWGCDPAIVKKKFGDMYYNHLMQGITKWIEKDLLIMDKGKIILTDQGKLFADGIASDLFL
ncbi:MAG TPA: radical SAM family heme chaperone HemW [Bacteroidales bacterium]|nr:radical SAM family heme chaperone HemW [Bacteroidales bacterium]